MKNQIKSKNSSMYEAAYITLLVCIIMLAFSCSKQGPLEHNTQATDVSEAQTSYLTKIKGGLKDSLNAKDFSTLDFTKLYQSKDVNSKNYFLRLTITGKPLSTDFILLKTDTTGEIIKGKIVHVTKASSMEAGSGSKGYLFTLNSLNRKTVNYISNTHTDLMEEEPVGEQTLEDVVVTGYIYGDASPIDWFSYGELLGDYAGGNGGGTYTYGQAVLTSGGGGIQPDPVSNITTETNGQPAIDISKYIKCFSSVSNQNAAYKMTIYSDIPVNSNPDELFNFKTGDVGHTFLQLTKTSGSNSVTQNIGFYPQVGWKSIEANGPVPSKLVDNAGHEFNASLTVNIDAAHFQTALNEIQYYSTSRYDIDNFNCTDFALNVFNSAAPLYLDIPVYHIPGGMYGELSNTPEGLYNELTSLNENGGYAGGQIVIPGVAGYVGASHGPCN